MKSAKTRWIDESNQVGDGEVALRKDFCDEETEISILRLTSYPTVNSNIYTESELSASVCSAVFCGKRRPLCWLDQLAMAASIAAVA